MLTLAGGSSVAVAAAVAAVCAFCAGLLLGLFLGNHGWRRSGASVAESDEQASSSGAWKQTPRRPDAVGEMKMALLVRTDLGMQKGKIAAQCGHAVLGAYRAAVQQKSHFLRPWEATGAKKIALKMASEEELLEMARRARERSVPHHMVRDAGHTQVAPHTRTVCAIGPAPSTELDALGCKDLKLL
mmetsp:Transcript_46821/g.102314  ORF Transcript_46821/g.102314 Transcript_46821/m.102314 type:complete len:186 (+) Transcript_46821:152-709(+)